MTTKQLGGIKYFPHQLKIPLTSNRITLKLANRKPPTQHARSTATWQGAIGSDGNCQLNMLDLQLCGKGPLEVPHIITPS